MQKWKENREKKQKLEELAKEQEEAVKRSDELLKLEENKTQTFARQEQAKREKFVPDFDESEVPDLE